MAMAVVCERAEVGRKVGTEVLAPGFGALGRFS